MRVRGYAPATPCWAEYMTADPAGAAAFYSGLFGWTPGEVFALDGRAVAGLLPGEPGRQSSWLCYVSAVAAEDGVAAVLDAGGSVLVPAHDRGPRGRAALVADSAGAVFGLWQRGTSGGAEAAAEPATMCWTEVVTWDEASAVEFYGKAFHWAERKSELAEGVDHIEWYVDSRTVGGLSVMDERYPAGTPAHWRVTFEVEDCAATIARCLELGGSVLTGPLDLPVGHYALLADPQGGTFGVIALSDAILDTRL